MQETNSGLFKEYPKQGDIMRTKSVIIFLKDQSGAALVIALLMMLVLTMISLASIFASTFEVKLSGNKRGSTEAFYQAENGVHAVVANVENFNLAKYDPITHQCEPNPSPSEAQVTIERDLTIHGSPRGLGFSATNFEFERYLIRSTGQDQTEIGANRSTSGVREKVVRLVPTLQGGY
jgi:hypothetical protein